ncbi:hypothetical protein ASG73_08625 [Janibacter sp. Soil728]|nr:hypothetical protein ASG73_08625 [Janibacter sp. Soil728]
MIGDAASLSALAATLRRAALQLRADAERLEAALEDASPGWTGPTATSTRRRTAAVGASLETVAASLDACAGSLQRAATDLSGCTADLRAIEEQAVAAGFEVRDGRLVRTWGITGVADHGAEVDGDRVREALQERLHLLVSALGRLRARLAADCEQATALLGETSAALRR